jgi:hypothetical protein
MRDVNRCAVLLAVLLPACASSPEPAPPAAPQGVLELDGESALRTLLMDVGGPGGELTVECRVRGGAPAGTSTLFGNRHFGGFGVTWAHEELAPERPTAWLGVTHVPGTRRRGYVLARATSPWDYDRWTHVAMTFDGELLRLWVDGRLAAEAVARGKRRASKRPLVIGADAAGEGVGQFFTGRIDDVRVSDVVRYHAQFDPPAGHAPDASTLLLLDFDDPDAPFADRSANARAVEPVGEPRRMPAD